MRLRRITSTYYEAMLSGQRWAIRKHGTTRPFWRVYVDGRYYTGRRPRTLKLAREWASWLWLRKRLMQIKARFSGEGAAIIAACLYDTATAADASALAGRCQDSELFDYLKPIIREGNQAGVRWPDVWVGVAATLKVACKK